MQRVRGSLFIYLFKKMRQLEEMPSNIGAQSYVQIAKLHFRPYYILLAFNCSHLAVLACIWSCLGGVWIICILWVPCFLQTDVFICTTCWVIREMDIVLYVQIEQIPLGKDLGSGLSFSNHQLPNLSSRWAIQIKVSSELSSEEFICGANSARPTIKHIPMGPEKLGGGERLIKMILCS